MLRDQTIHVLSDEKMRALGFTDNVLDEWYYVASVNKGITLNIIIAKDSGVYREYVLDDDFGQPYPYMSIDIPFARKIRENVDMEVAKLNAAGLNVAVDHRLYNWTDDPRVRDSLNVETKKFTIEVEVKKSPTNEVDGDVWFDPHDFIDYLQKYVVDKKADSASDAYNKHAGQYVVSISQAVSSSGKKKRYVTKK